MLDCDKCSNIEGVDLFRLDSDSFVLDVNYPAHILTSTDTIYYFSFRFNLLLQKDRFVVLDKRKRELCFINFEDTDTVLNIGHLKPFPDGATSKIDTVFKVNSEIIYKVRLSSIWSHDLWEPPRGVDLVLFCSKNNGIVGSYISQIDEHLWDKKVKELIHFPKGYILFEKNQNQIGIINPYYY